jgi:hypothetical protein
MVKILRCQDRESSVGDEYPHLACISTTARLAHWGKIE